MDHLVYTKITLFLEQNPLAAKAIMATIMVMTTINSTRVNPLLPGEEQRGAIPECLEKYLIQMMQD